MSREMNLPHVRVTPPEKSAIERQAANCELSVSEFLRTIGQMDWFACPQCGKPVLLKYVSGFSGWGINPPEEGYYNGVCGGCGNYTTIPEGEYHDRK